MSQQPPLKRSQKKRPPQVSSEEWKRLQKLLRIEAEAREKGFAVIAGIDEAGRGPLAGPVVAAACIIPHDVFIIDIDDSKKLTPQKRAKLFDQIVSDNRIKYSVGIVSNTEIDQINILQATIKAMLLAVEALPLVPDLLLIDGMKIPHPQIPSEKVIGGDALSHTIATASVIAKETRDRLMNKEHEQWPLYGFDKNKGYGTEQHLVALEKYGPCPLHRFSFEPVKSKP